MAEGELTHIDKMTNVELRAELKRRGCPTSGNKKDLIARLNAALQKEKEKSALNNSVESEKDEISITQSTAPIDAQVNE